MDKFTVDDIKCPNCGTDEHLYHCSGGFWCNGCGGGLESKERRIRHLEATLFLQRELNTSHVKLIQDLQKKLREPKENAGQEMKK